MEISKDKLLQIAIAAKAKQITSIVSKLNANQALTVYEQKVLNQFVDEQMNGEDESGGGRFLSGQEVADHYGVKRATVFAHVKKGHIRQNPDGTFDKSVCDAYWCDRLGRPKKPIHSKGEISGDGTTIQTVADQIEEQKLRKSKAEATIKEILADQMKGRVAPIDEVIRAWCARYRMVRDSLVSLIDRMPPLLVGMSQAEIDKTLKDEIYSILNGFAKDGRYTPKFDE